MTALSGLDKAGLLSVMVMALSGLDVERSEFKAAVDGALVEPSSEGSGLLLALRKFSVFSSRGTPRPVDCP